MNRLGFLVLFILFLANNGCSAAMALHGYPEPNLTAIDTGLRRVAIEKQLADPVSIIPSYYGTRIAVYEYIMGDKPNGTRAFMNILADAYTFGFYELAAIPAEATMGNRFRKSVTYNSNDEAIAMGDPVVVPWTASIQRVPILVSNNSTPIDALVMERQNWNGHYKTWEKLRLKLKASGGKNDESLKPVLQLLSNNLRLPATLADYDKNQKHLPLFIAYPYGVASDQPYGIDVTEREAADLRAEEETIFVRPTFVFDNDMNVKVESGVLVNGNAGKEYPLVPSRGGAGAQVIAGTMRNSFGGLPPPASYAPAPSGDTDSSLRGVAIYPFTAKGGAQAATAEALAGLFQSELSTNPCLRIVAEDIINDLARQQGLEQQCGTEVCQVDLAKQAQAQVLVRGDLLQVGNEMLITAMAIDLGSRQTILSKRVRAHEDALIDATVALATAFAEQLGCAAPRP